MIERLRTLGSYLLGSLWRLLRLPPLQGQQPDEEERTEPPHEGMYPGSMRDDPGEHRPPVGQ